MYLNQADAAQRLTDLCLQYHLAAPEIHWANTRYDYVLADASMIGLSWDSGGRDEKAVLRRFAEYVIRSGVQESPDNIMGLIVISLIADLLEAKQSS